MSKSRFEKELENYFPEVAALHRISKKDRNVITAIYAIIDMHEENSYGRVEVSYQNGKINHVTKSVKIQARRM